MIQQEDLTVINTYVCYNRVQTYETKVDGIEGRNSSVTIFGYFDAPLSVVGRRTGQKINEDKMTWATL